MVGVPLVVLPPIIHLGARANQTAEIGAPQVVSLLLSLSPQVVGAEVNPIRHRETPVGDNHLHNKINLGMIKQILAGAILVSFILSKKIIIFQ